MWSLKVILLVLLCCCACLSASNGSIYFKSRNFYNVLHWDPVNNVLPGKQVLYTVRYWSDVKDQPYKTKVECENITALFCDLTAETSSSTDRYIAQVLANGLVHGRTNVFKPIGDTILGQPNVFTDTTVSSLHVNVTLPLGPNNISIADIFSSTRKRLSSPLIYYILNITHPKWATQVNRSTTGQFVINLKNNRTKYCGYVVYMPNFEWGRHRSEKTSFCFTLRDDAWRILPWLFISTGLLVIIATISVVYMCCYVRGGKAKSMPQSLQEGTVTIQPPVLQSTDKNLFISKVEFCPKTDQTVYSLIQVKPNIQPVSHGGYSPQDACLTLPGSFDSSMSTGVNSSTRCQETSTQSSENYVAVHVPAEENEDLQQDTDEVSEGINLPRFSVLGKPNGDKGEAKLNLHDAPLLPHLDTSESNPGGPMHLHTVRDPKGKLLLPTLIFQLQSSTFDTVSSPDQEGQPLLSDLIETRKEAPSLSCLHSLEDSEGSDSGCDQSSVNTPRQIYCNSHFSPTQPLLPKFHTGCQSTTFESGYKQNWIPAIPFGPENNLEHRRTNLPWTWTDPKNQEDKEEERETIASQILLGDWIVRIQE